MNGHYLKCSVCIYGHLLYVLPTSMELLPYFYSIGYPCKVVAGRSVEVLHKTHGGNGGIVCVLRRFC